MYKFLNIILLLSIVIIFVADTLAIPLLRVKEPSKTSQYDKADSESFTLQQHDKAEVNIKFPKTMMKNHDAIAVIIGNKNYSHKDVPNVSFAHNDADIFRQCLTETMGYKEGNIIFKKDATKVDFETIFGNYYDYSGQLDHYIKPNKSDVFIYYSGHGAPDPKSKKGFFMPVNCNPAFINLSGYPLEVFYKNVSKLKAKSITIVIDACFSGGTSSGQMLIKSASPIGINVKNPAIAKKNTLIFTSSKGDQISSWYDAKKHSLFTYFFLKALSGSADTDNNMVITTNEVYKFVSDRTEGVPYWARRLHGGRIQVPDIQGGIENNVLVKLAN